MRGRRATAINKRKAALAIATIAAIRAMIVALLICKLNLPLRAPRTMTIFSPDRSPVHRDGDFRFIWR
jgi:hypothetical protein